MASHSKKTAVDLAAYALVTRDFLENTLRALWQKEHAAIRAKLGAEQVQELRYALNSLNALLDVVKGPYEEVEEDD